MEVKTTIVPGAPGAVPPTVTPPEEATRLLREQADERARKLAERCLVSASDYLSKARHYARSMHDPAAREALLARIEAASKGA